MKIVRYLILLAIVAVAGCEKDYTIIEDSGTLELKKAKVPIPTKVKLCATYDMESDFLLLPIPGIDPDDPNNYYATRMLISGTSSHLGRVDAEKSYYDVETFEFAPEDGVPFLVSTGIGKLVAVNGDSYMYNWWAKVSLPDFSWIGGIEIIPGSGTGRFEGCLGSNEMIGQADPINQINCWTAEGYMIFE